ncbi:MAG: PilZ domain-containing protein [Candidatus Omnitrophota bacterium]
MIKNSFLWLKNLFFAKVIVQELKEKNLELEQKISKQAEEKLKLQKEINNFKGQISDKSAGLEAYPLGNKDKESTSFSERRKFSRLELSVDIKYSVVGRELLLESQGRSKNISPAGIHLIVDEQIELGDVLSLVIKLPEDDCPIQVKGVVRWRAFVWATDVKDTRTRWGLGIEFIDINEADRRKISKFEFVSF